MNADLENVIWKTVEVQGAALYLQGPPGPPPPGKEHLQWNPQSHRWVNPNRLPPAGKPKGGAAEAGGEVPKKGDVVTVPGYDGTGSFSARVTGRPIKNKGTGGKTFIPVRNEHTQWSVPLEQVTMGRKETPEEKKGRRGEERQVRDLRERERLNRYD